jgi:hypothetical protein
MMAYTQAVPERKGRALRPGASGNSSPAAYRSLSLIQLASRIAGGDWQALEEFHTHQRPFWQGAGSPLRFIQHLECFRINYGPGQVPKKDVVRVLKRALEFLDQG